MNGMKSHHRHTIRVKMALDAQQEKAHHAIGSSASKQREHVVSTEDQLNMRRAIEAIRRSPEIRADRVEAIRAQIKTGTYRIDSTTLARKLLGLSQEQSPDENEWG